MSLFKHVSSVKPFICMQASFSGTTTKKGQSQASSQDFQQPPRAQFRASKRSLPPEISRIFFGNTETMKRKGLSGICPESGTEQETLHQNKDFW